MFSLEACVASCIYNRHLTVTRVLGANTQDTRQDGSKRSRQEQTNTRAQTKESDYAYINAHYAPRAHWKNQRARAAKGNLLKITPASTAIKSRANSLSYTGMATLALGRTTLEEDLILMLRQRDMLL